MFKPIKWLLAAGIAANLSAVGVGTGIGAGAAFAQEITGAGATFPAPIYAKWAEAYQKATGVKMNYQSIGSSGGIRQINAKTVDFGASDAPLEPTQLEKEGLVQFPMVMGGVVPVFNLEGVKPGGLKLTGALLADIYLGKVSKWNAPEIAALNAGVKLPNQDITVVARSDGSGTTFIFTHYLSKVSGECTSMVGCSAEASFQALKRTPATYSPERPVVAIGMRRPLQAMTCRSGTKPSTLTCSRSTELSTKRTVPPAPGSSPITCQGSSALRMVRSMPATAISPIIGKRNSKCGANQVRSIG